MLPVGEIIEKQCSILSFTAYLNNMVNTFFAITGNKQHFPKTINNTESKLGININNLSNTRSNFKVNTIGNNDIVKVLNNLNNYSSSGPDGLTAIFIK